MARWLSASGLFLSSKRVPLETPPKLTQAHGEWRAGNRSDLPFTKSGSAGWNPPLRSLTHATSSYLLCRSLQDPDKMGHSCPQRKTFEKASLYWRFLFSCASFLFLEITFQNEFTCTWARLRFRFPRRSQAKTAGALRDRGANEWAALPTTCGLARLSPTWAPTSSAKITRSCHQIKKFNSGFQDLAFSNSKPIASGRWGMVEAATQASAGPACWGGELSKWLHLWFLAYTYYIHTHI